MSQRSALAIPLRVKMRAGERAPLFHDKAPREPWYRIENKSKTETPKIYIYDEIGAGWFGGISAQDFANELNALDATEIDVHLNSPGGDMFEGIAIYNALVTHKATINMYVDALAASAASFIAQAGDNVIMTTGSMMMIHDGIGLVWGNAQDMRDSATLLDKMSDNIASIYTDRAGESQGYWRDLMKAETWFTAQEAVDYKLADEVRGAAAQSEAEVKNSWNLKAVFNYAGRSEAPSPAQIREKIINRGTEAPVGKTTNNSEGQPATPSADPANQPGTPTEASPNSPDTNPPVDPENPDEETLAPGETNPPNTGVSAEGTVPPPANRARTGSAFSFTIGGQPETDPAKVQAHIESLETQQSEQRDAARKSFVENLAKDNKIMAPQVDDLVEFALDLSDKQYAKWSASWDAATPSALLTTPVVNNGTGSNPAAVDAVDQIAMYKGIVEQHVKGGMKESQIKNTASYKKLIQLDPDFTL